MSLMGSVNLFTLAFLAALATSVGLRVWLSARQWRHVTAHRGSVPPNFTGSVSLADHQKAADYTRARIKLSGAALAVETGLLLVFTLGGLLQRLDDFWLGLFHQSGYGQGLALFASVGLIGFLVDLPFSIYQTLVIEARFGFNKMTWRLLFSDLVKRLALAVILGAPLLLAALWLMTAMGSRWWCYVWLFWLGFNLLMMVIYPVLIAPLFNKFSPLPDSELKTKIENLLQRCRFTVSGLLVMDGSKRSTHGNAYFTGLGKAKRIVFFDTLIDKLTPEETAAVLAHELGHYRHRHIGKQLAMMALVSLGLLWLLGQLIARPWFYQGLGVARPSTVMALILFSQILPVFLFVLTPLASWLSRRQEYQADAYAVQQTTAQDLITALVKLFRDNASTLTPDPIHSLFYDSHPPASLRIGRLRTLGANRQTP